MKIMLNTLALVVAFGSLAACSKDGQNRPSETARSTETPQVGAEPQPASRTASAAESIAEARCMREQRCENIGADKKYSSGQDCLTRIRSDWKDDLNARECPYGIKQHQLDECLQAVRAEDCSNPFDTLSRAAACTKSQICAD